MQRQSLNGNITATKTAPRPLQVAICGEVSSGKSTLLNALFRGRHLPDNMGQTTRPRIVAGVRDCPGIEAEYPDGSLVQLDIGADPETLRGASQIRLWLDAPELRRFEFIEVPLSTAEEIDSSHIERMRNIDMLIWVTIASQAWRLTEKTMLERFGDALPKQTMIVISRGDKLRSIEDRDKLMGRVRRETDGIFGDCRFLMGAKSVIDAAAQSNEAWAESGAEAIRKSLCTLAGVPLTEPEPRSLSEEEGRKLVDLATFRKSADTTSRREPPAEPDTSARAADLGAPADAAPELSKPAEPSAASESRPENHEAKARNEAPVTRLKPKPSASPTVANDTQPAKRKDAGQGAENASRTVVTPEILANLAGATEILPAGACSGVIQDDICSVICGCPARVSALGEVLSSMMVNLDDLLERQGQEDTVEALSIASSGTRIACELVPGFGLVFLLGDSGRMSAGTASAVLTRMASLANNAPA
ncbi:hypothetical protein GCM10011415_07640 [Salipiger pallidus]|uniref:Dynamin N-terminal domain-containing protein n=1 Tax=Salipiger pallidus TaxID=1775170 RepID=A0A8J2ZHL4_9RHOB|nr:dynamin family protein [Salipiger pallidus]GGG63649.1 hypothetical protein GCM10011415_07640 [Salipiger pallidus]